MFGWSIKLFRVRGIQLAVHWSFLLLLGYVAWDGYRDAGAGGAWWGSAELLGFFTCIVLHELGHSLTAMRFGVTVRRILLLPIGGMAEFDQIPRSPRQELLITVAGPAVNFVIAAFIWAVHRPIGVSGLATPANWGEYFEILMYWNLVIGVFNLIPAFPMDGGRILRAGLAFKLPYARATFWAATVGKVFCVIGIIAGLCTGRWLMFLLFLFIVSVGEMEYRSVLARERREAEWAEYARRAERPDPGAPTEPPFLGPT